jgi:hypothetical protein
MRQSSGLKIAVLVAGKKLGSGNDRAMIPVVWRVGLTSAREFLCRGRDRLGIRAERVRRKA